MRYSEALFTVDLIIKSGAVPLLIGESGIGKTSLVKTLSREKKYFLINIDANLLKEGEIGGLPTVEEYEAIEGGKHKKKKRTVYAVHTKLMEIDEYIKENPGKKVLLFIDEINRCEHSVQQELMNLILNREINGYYLHENVYVIAAMNPSNKYDSFEDSEYSVVDMDPAQEDRFVWVDMEADSKEWIKWGMSKYGDIHPHILEFISIFPNHLHTPNVRESIKATPRSWERISNAYKIYINNKEQYSMTIFYNVVKGNVGGNIGADFMAFIENYKELPIKPEDFFNEAIISETVRENILKEGHSRLYIIVKNLLQYLNDNKYMEKELTLFSKLLLLYPVDLRIGIMKEIRGEYREGIYKELLDNDIFLEVFFQSF